MNLNDLKKKFVVSSIIKLIASFGVFLFNFFIIYFLDNNTLGILNSAISLIVFLSIFTKFGLNLATLKLTSIFFEDKNIFKINQLIIQSIIISGTISIFISLGIIIFENFITSNIYKTDEIKERCSFLAKFATYYNFIFYVLCYIIPSSLQFTSMVFAYIKQKDNKTKTTTNQEDILSSYSST